MRPLSQNVFYLCLLLSLTAGSAAFAGAYLDSAHGNTSYGVNRTDTASEGYSTANCAHCHEQHASIEGSEPTPCCSGPSPYALFADNFTSQTDDFCFGCHKGVGSLQTSFSRQNYNFSYWFGGDTVHHLTPDNIYDAFNPAIGSSHNLQDILDFVKTRWPATFKDESNPCSACHNAHVAKRGYPVVRPTDRDNSWGDEPGERMNDYAVSHGGQYQAPARYGGGYEPDGSAVTDGSNLPDYVTFCSDCHDNLNTIYSSTLGRNLKKIDWANGNRSCAGYLPGDYHGSITRCFGIQGNDTTSGCGCSEAGCSNWGELKEPYYSANYTNFILACTDCHEPHGAVDGLDNHAGHSYVPYLLRKTICGYYNGYVPGGAGPTIAWERWFCQSCHVPRSHCGSNIGSCFNCHFHNAYARCFACTWCVEPGAPTCVHGHSF